MRTHDRWLLAASYGLAVTARSIPFVSKVFDSPTGVPVGYVDSLYHLRRVELILLGGHVTPPPDPYSAWPTGGDFFWPPLFDYLLAAVTWVVTLGDPTRASIQWVGAIAPPLVASLIVWPVWSVAHRAAGTVAGHVAALAIAVAPVHVVYSALGRADHHGVETLLFASYLALALALVQRCEERGAGLDSLVRRPGSRRARFPLGLLVACALAGFALVSVQMGAVLLAGIIPVYAGLRFCIAVARRDSCEPLLVATFAAQALATLLLVPGNAFWGGTRRFDLVYNQASMFQPVLYGLFALFSLYLLVFARHVAPALPRALAPPFAVAGGAVLFLVLPLALSPALLDAVLAAGGWVASREVYLTLVLETRSLLVRDGALTFEPLWEYGRLVIPLGLAGCVVSLIRPPRSASARRAVGFVAVWGLAALALSIDQVRFVSFLAAPMSVFCGILASSVFGTAGQPGPPMQVRRLGLGALVLLLIGTSGLHEVRRRSRAFHSLDRARVEACRWLERNTPPPGDDLRPSREVDYGVLCHPAHGHHVLYFGRRPATANPFFDRDGIARTAAFLLATDAESAVRAMRSARCRYAFLTGGCTDIVKYASLLPDEERAAWESAGPGTPERAQRLACTPCVALYAASGNAASVSVDGHPVEVEAAYDRFRLVYESPPSATPPRVQIFELVEGARLAGATRPGALVELRVPVRTTAGRAFEFARRTTAGRDGRFELVCPYASGTGPARVSVLSRHRPGPTLNVDIPEEAVLEGARIPLDFPATSR